MGSKKEGLKKYINRGKREEREDGSITYDNFTNGWENSYACILRFKHREEHCDAPASHKEDNIDIGYWLKRQKEQKKDGKLDPIYQQRLEDIGVRWYVQDCSQGCIPKYGKWGSAYSSLVQFRKPERHLNIKPSYRDNGIYLYAWLCLQRKEKKERHLDSTYLQRLEDIGVARDKRSERWGKAYLSLIKFKERERHCNVERDHIENGIHLHKWLYWQRKKKKEGHLDSTCQQLLENIGIIWG